MIKIAITDDHQLVINGILEMIGHSQNFQFTGAYLNGRDLLEDLKQGNLPEVLLLDIQMPGLSGEEITTILKKKYPQIRILVLTNFNASLYINSMFQLGVDGFLLKNTTRETLINAIETVWLGEQFVDENLREKYEAFRKKAQKKERFRFTLTEREKAILQLVIKGMTNKEIANTLFLSQRTVENYRLNLSLKLDAKNTADLIRIAIELGIYE